MKRAWLILDAVCPKSIQQQEAELIACCKEKDIEIVGKSTYGTRFCAEVSEIISIAQMAVNNQCDYVAAADESCITDDYGVLARTFLPFEKDGLTLYIADKGEILSEFFKEWPLIRYRYRDPDEFSIDNMLEEGNNPEYPRVRTLDCSMFQIRRQGNVAEFAFTDLCEMEQKRILDTLPVDCLRALCEELAWTLRYIGDQFDIFRSGQGGIFAMDIVDRNEIKERYKK